MSADHDCNQEQRLIRIEADVLNHKKWREETSKQLSNIEVMVATINERVKGKMDSFDEHVKVGTAFRTTLLFTIMAMVGSVVTAVYVYGGLAKQVEVNTKRLEHAERVVVE